MSAPAQIPADPLTGRGARRITCILPKGAARPLLEGLKSRFGIVAANVHNASGEGQSTPAHHGDIGARSEREVLHVAVAEAEAERVFAFLFENAGIDRPGGGLIYQSRLSRRTEFELPDLPGEA